MARTPLETAAAEEAPGFPAVCACAGPGHCPGRGREVNASVHAACARDERFRWGTSGRPRAEWPDRVKSPKRLGRPGPAPGVVGTPLTSSELAAVKRSRGTSAATPKAPKAPPRFDCAHRGALSYACPVGMRERDIHHCDLPDAPWGRCWASAERARDGDDVASCALCLGYEKPGDARGNGMRKALRAAVETPPPQLRGEGRGVVQVVGGSLYTSLAFLSARALRASGCTLPLEWWHLGPHEWDPNMDALAADVGAKVVDARAFAESLPKRPRRLWEPLGGWGLKAFAVLHSSFAEVLFLDADNVVARDPTYVFESRGYREQGAVFWPDLPPVARPYWVPPDAWVAAGMRPRPGATPLESGQFAVDRRRHAHGLAITWAMNDWSDFWYNRLYGDKDTFLFGFGRAALEARRRHAYALAPRPLFVAPCIHQHGPGGELLFQHNTGAKQDVLRGGALSGFVFRDALAGALADLRRLWGGRLWPWQGQSREEAGISAGAAGRWHCHVRGKTWPLELLPGGQTGGPGKDADGLVTRWSFRELGGAPTLILLGKAHKDSEIAAAFLSPGGRCWAGRLTYGDGPIELEGAL